MILDKTIYSKSGRIALVPPSEADDASNAILRCHPETLRHLQFFPTHFSTEDARARRLARADDKELVDFNIHALLTESGTPTFAGTTGIFKINTDHASSCEVGILIDPAFFRGGLATDALYTVLAYVFEERKLHRAVFQTSVHNAAMCGWLERAGATLEGTEREAWTDGRGGYTDVRLYSVLDREWVPGSVKGNLEARINRAQAGGGSAASGP